MHLMHIQCKVFIDQRANRFFRLHRVELDEQEFVLRNWCVLRWFSFKNLEIKKQTYYFLWIACTHANLPGSQLELSICDVPWVRSFAHFTSWTWSIGKFPLDVHYSKALLCLLLLRKEKRKMRTHLHGFQSNGFTNRFSMGLQAQFRT